MSFYARKKATDSNIIINQITTVVDFGDRYYEYEKKRFLL